jgi:hypothetical protein
MLELPHNPTIAAVGGFPKFVWDRMWGFLFLELESNVSRLINENEHFLPLL